MFLDVVQNTLGNNRYGLQTTNNGWGTTINNALVTPTINAVTTKSDTAITAKTNTVTTPNLSTGVFISWAANNNSGSRLGKTLTDVTSNTQDGGHLSLSRRLGADIVLQRREHFVTTQNWGTEHNDMRPASWNLRRKFKATERGTAIRKKGLLKRTHHL